MAKTHFRSVDEYIAAQPPIVQRLLERVRNTIRKTLPGAEEMISYNLPTYKMSGRPVVYFAGWKEHYSLYSVTDRIIAELKDELAAFEYNDKGTVRFSLAQAVPVTLIAQIAKLRAKEVMERQKGEATMPKRRSNRD